MPPARKTPDSPAEAPRRAPRPRPAKAIPADVVAVLVAHDGATWLPEALAALAASTRTPSRVLCVDTGSTDGSAELLEAAYGHVLRLPRDTGYGAAVAAALAQESVPAAGWLWLLHDDCAVEPDTLEALLAHAQESPSVGILGPKARDWHDPRLLVEVGVTVDAAGHRETGLERREYDQGQHDAVRDVLAVGTAGALVRRELWDRLGGLEPALPVFRDDLDLGWRANSAGARVVLVPAARVRHARAATTGRRQTDAAPGRATGTDRRNALFVLLAHASALHLVGLLPRLALATLLRALGLLLTRQLPAAADELRALGSVLGHPGRLRAARRARAATRTVPTRDLRGLFASRSVRLRARLGAISDVVGGGAAPGSHPLGALGDPGPEGPGELDDLVVVGSGALRRFLLRPGVLLVLSLSALALVAERSVLAIGGGRLAGGVLLPAPGGARDLWASYLDSWHEVSVGTSAVAPPGTGVLAALSTVLLGKPWLAVDLLLLVSVPLAGLAAYVAAGRVVRHLVLRVWAGATWALLPVATGAVAAGRLDAAAVQVGLPLVLLGAGRLLTGDPVRAGWSRAWATGLGLAVLVALAPLLWPLAVIGLLAAALVPGRAQIAPRLARAVLAAVAPALLLLPWSLSALLHPTLLLGAAAEGPRTSDLSGTDLLLLSPGGPGLPLVLVTLGLVLAGVAGTVRRARRRLAVLGCGLALLGLASAALLVRHALLVPGQTSATTAWPGVPLQLAAAGLLLAALVGADGVRSRLAESDFGWRQLLAGLVAVSAAVVPLATGLGWATRGTDGPLRRNAQGVLPAFAQAELAARPGTRVLVLVPQQGGQLHYALTGADGGLLPDTGTPPRRGQSTRLDAVVADLVTPRGSDAAEALSTRAVRYVALRQPARAAGLAEVLDTQPGLVRRTSGSVLLWQVVAPADRLAVLPPALARQARSGSRAPSLDLLRTDRPLALPSGARTARATLRPGPPGRLLVLAEAQDRGWRATLDGRPLTRRTAWGWAQGFVLPPRGGHLLVVHEQSRRHLALGGELALLLLAGVLSVPSRRVRRGLVDDDLPDAEEQS